MAFEEITNIHHPVNHEWLAQFKVTKQALTCQLRSKHEIHAVFLVHSWSFNVLRPQVCIRSHVSVVVGQSVNPQTIRALVISIRTLDTECDLQREDQV